MYIRKKITDRRLKIVRAFSARQLVIFMKINIRELPGRLKQNWKTPPEGRYMPFREIASLSVGGIGEKFIVYCVGQMIISTGNGLLANTIGIDPVPLYVIYILSILAGVPLTGLRAAIIDNTRSMKGKYRPYIISMGIPTVLLGTGFILMPYEKMSLVMKCVTVLLFNIGFQFFYNFFQDSYDSLVNVLSPDSVERSDVLSVKSVIENLSPSLANIAFPLLVKALTGENTLYSLRAYRLTFPPMLFLGMMITILVYTGTEEKIVRAKSHYVGIGFTDALIAVAKNKNFWIVSLAGWVGFLEGAFANILQWMYNYRGACSEKEYALIVAITGNASFWPNIVGPFLIRRYGKRNVLIWSNLLNIVFISCMLPLVRNADAPGIIRPLVVFVFINQFITSLGYLMGFSVNADLRDYQQYLTGERIDGMFAAVGLIGSGITMVTGMVLPYIYKLSGLNREVAESLGYDGSNVYNVLYDAGYFKNICSVLVIASVIGAALNVIPYFFYDLTETKQAAVIKILKIRAFIEDGDLEIASSLALSAVAVPQTECLTKKDRRRKAGEEKTAAFVREELNYFSTEKGIAELELSRKIVAAGMGNMFTALSSAGSLPGEIRRAKRTADRYFPAGTENYDMTAADNALSEYNETEKEIFAISGTGEGREKLAALRERKKQLSKTVKANGREYTRYRRATAPYTHALYVTRLYEGYTQINRSIYD